jgi:hypothetical protein
MPVFRTFPKNFIGCAKRIDLEGSVPLGYDDDKLDKQLTTLRKNTSPSSSIIHRSKKALRAFVTPGAE